MFNLPEGWIVQKTGVLERRWVTSETSTFMGAQAARQAVADAGMTLNDIDLIVNASATWPQAIPDGAHLLQRELGLESSGNSCMTVHTTCLSFVTALDISASFLATGRYQNILIVTADVITHIIDFKQPETCVLFGDAAAAAVVTLTPDGEASAIEAAHTESYSIAADTAMIAGCGTNKPPNHPGTKPSDNLFSMEGLRVYMLGRQHFSPFLEKLRPRLSKDLGTIKYVIPHQASMMVIRAYREYGVPDEKVFVTIEKNGNCGAASLPLTLYTALRSGRVQRGDELLLIGLGAGLCIGGIILTY
jgi:3-oxoacyl-[acyl-carrier-protein] synthase-3